MRTVCNLTMTIHCTRVQLILLWEVPLPLLFLCTMHRLRIHNVLPYNSVPIESVQIWVGAICRSQQEQTPWQAEVDRCIECGGHDYTTLPFVC